jgi:hypothetical protein
MIVNQTFCRVCGRQLELVGRAHRCVPRLALRWWQASQRARQPRLVHPVAHASGELLRGAQAPASTAWRRPRRPRRPAPEHPATGRPSIRSLQTQDPSAPRLRSMMQRAPEVGAPPEPSRRSLPWSRSRQSASEALLCEDSWLLSQRRGAKQTYQQILRRLHPYRYGVDLRRKAQADPRQQVGAGRS